MSIQSPAFPNPLCQAIVWQNNRLYLLDQRELPHRQRILEYDNAAQVSEAIRLMVIHGAPATGIAAAYAYVLDALRGHDLQQTCQQLIESQPTAADLPRALARMQSLNTDNPQHLLSEATRIHQENIKANQSIGRLGSALLTDDSRIYTHGYTGVLSTGGHGTALGAIISAHRQGRVAHVHVGETRPCLTGTRLTAWELAQANIPMSLCTDGAAACLFHAGEIDWLMIGAERVAANGDIANTTGTYNLALLARHHGAKVMAVAATSTFDISLESGRDIAIESRPACELTEFNNQPVAPASCDTTNPACDITPAEFIDVIVCERGVILEPGTETLSMLFAR